MHNSLQIQGHLVDWYSWAEQILREDAQLSADTRPPSWPVQLGWTDPQRRCTTRYRYKATLLIDTAVLNRSSERMHNSLQIQGHHLDQYSWAKQILREDAQLATDTRPPCWLIQLAEQILREDAQLSADTRPPSWPTPARLTDPRRGRTSPYRYKATIMTNTAGLNKYAPLPQKKQGGY